MNLIRYSVMLLLVLNGGCAIYTSQPVSVPSTNNSAWKVKTECWYQSCVDATYAIEGPVGRIGIKAHNKGDRFTFMILPVPVPLGTDDRVRGNNELFPITLRFDVGGDKISFIPDHVRVHLEAAGDIAPIAYRIREAAKLACMTHDYRELKKRELSGFISIRGQEEVNINKGTCVDFVYDITPPTPKTPFSLEFTHIYSNGVELNIPPVNFHEGKITPGW